MARPLTGTKTDRDGSYTFACPSTRGSRQRRQATFDTAQERDEYAVAALAALQAGKPLPSADAFRGRRAVAKPPRDTSFRAIADAWYEQHYGTLRRAGADRASAVRRLLDDPVIPFFDARVTGVEDLTQDLVIDFYASFRRPSSAACEQRSQAQGRPLPGSDPGWQRQELTLPDAARLCGVSLSTVKRAVAPGGKVTARRDPRLGCRVVLVRDLVAAGMLVADGTGCNPDPRSVGYARLAIDIVKGVCRYARANGVDVPDVTDGLRLVDDAPRAPQRALTWQECRRLAGHLHPVWQVAFWLMRSLGLRISEAFGLRVEDVLDLGDGGLIDVFRQGGKPFQAYAPDGSIVTVQDKQTPKTASSIRLIVACEPVLAMLRVVVEAFHTDPVTGRVDGRARLVPGLADAGRGGQAGFRAALAAAAVVEGLDSDSLDFRVSSHLLRKSLTTELAWDPALQESAKRHYVGQRAADDVFGRTYTLGHPHLAPTRAVALAVGADIDLHMSGTLLVPTARRFTFRSGNPLRDRAAHTWAVLDEAGWTEGKGPSDDPLLDAAATAGELGVSETTARRWMASGRLPSVPVALPGQPVTRHARLSAIQAVRAQSTRFVRLPELAVELELGYHETRTMVRRLGLDPGRDGRTGELLLDKQAADTVRREAARLRALHQRSIRIAHAAVELATGVVTVNALVRAGTLVLDPETDPSHAKYVTRQSVAVEKATRSSPPGSIRHDDAQTFSLKAARAATGLPEGMLLALAAAGQFHRSHSRGRAWAVTRQSVTDWAIAYRPDLLSRIDQCAACE